MPIVVVQGTVDPGAREQPDTDVIASCAARLRLLDEYDEDQCTALHLALLNGAVLHHTASLGSCALRLAVLNGACSVQFSSPTTISIEHSNVRQPEL
jgi:hypothetical protein